VVEVAQEINGPAMEVLVDPEVELTIIVVHLLLD
jgi:hypothetical protein